MPESLVLDLTRPDTGRVVDYWLGGNHNFGVDRLAAAQVEALTPVAQIWVRAQRSLVGASIDRFTRGEHLDRFLVLGAGLPTCGNVHEFAPSARVLYSDVSPVTAAYGQHLLIGSPQTKYVQADARTIRASHAILVHSFLGRDNPGGSLSLASPTSFPTRLCARCSETCTTGVRAAPDWPSPSSGAKQSCTRRQAWRLTRRWTARSTAGPRMT